MDNLQQNETNIKHQNFLSQLDKLAVEAAEAQAKIASEAAKHEFEIKFKYYISEKMKIAAEETYAEILSQVQAFVDGFAVNASKRALGVESSTPNLIEEFKPSTPQFASFGETVSRERNKQKNLLKVSSQTNSESDILALKSLGIAEESE